MTDYERIAKIICYLDQNRFDQPDLAALASHAGLSEFHFHRLFSRWAGVTPKAFLQCLTLAHAKTLLRRGESVLGTALDAGLSGPSRLHDLCVNLEAASPGEMKSGGANWTIMAGFADSPFGTCLIAKSPRGICHLSFVPSKNQRTGTKAIRSDWPRARIDWDDSAAQETAASLFKQPSDDDSVSPLRAFVCGTSFQVRVWRALLQIPQGTLVSYGQVAEAVCSRNAARAVGTAVAANRLACLIPCHRVIRETGVFGEYRWGPERKRAIVAWESAVSTLEPDPKCFVS